MQASSWQVSVPKQISKFLELYSGLKNYGNCIYQLIAWIFEHSKFIQISSFIFLLNNRTCTEATHKFSEFLEL